MDENKYDVIDVEVEEEVIDTYEAEEIIDLDSEYSDEEIDSMCLSLKAELNSNNIESAYKIAQKIAKNSKEYLDNDTYLWTMYAYSLFYKDAGNVNAQRWCEIRMKDVIDAMKNKRLKQKALTFVDTDFPIEVMHEIENNTSFMEREIQSLGKQFVKVELTLGAAFLILVKFVFKYSWLLSFGMIALLMYVNYRVSYKSLVKRYISEQTKACKNFVNDSIIENFDLPVINS